MQLRWLAIIGQIATIAFVHFWLDIELPIFQMGCVIALLVTLNLIRIIRTRSSQPVSETAIFVDLLGDVLALTALLYLSGGALNPFIFIYLLQIIIATVLFRGWRTWIILLMTAMCFGVLIFWNVPMAIHNQSGLLSPSLHIQGMFICFLLVGALLVLFVGRISRNLAARDARVAELRQQAVEEDHVVRMGLLASGAAHELGTPLTTLSVILGDWNQMPEVRQYDGLRTDIRQMQSQLERCKEIVSGILASAGEARGEGAIQSSLHRFFEEIALEWKTARDEDILRYSNDFEPDIPIIADLTLRQAIFNLLDNAREASSSQICMAVSRDNDTAIVVVEDNGAGFPPEVIENAGKPYISTKNRPGAGLGLFLVTNVVRKLGGNVEIGNATGHGGARVIIKLPLSAIEGDLR